MPCGKYLRASASVFTIPSATSPLLITALAAASTHHLTDPFAGYDLEDSGEDDGKAHHGPFIRAFERR